HCLFFAIDSRRFSYPLFPIVEQIVLDLERHSYKFPEPSKRFYVPSVRLYGTGSQTTAGSDQGRGLLPNDLIIDLLGNVQTPCLFDLQQFALAHLPDSDGNYSEQIKIAIIYGQ